jgi:hypothetical protein
VKSIDILKGYPRLGAKGGRGVELGEMASKTKRMMVRIQLFPPLLVCSLRLRLRLRASCGRAYLAGPEAIPTLPSIALSVRLAYCWPEKKKLRPEEASWRLKREKGGGRKRDAE